MRIARDLILVICAVISTACLLYIAMNLDTASVDDSTPGTAAAAEDTPKASSLSDSSGPRAESEK